MSIHVPQNFYRETITRAVTLTGATNIYVSAHPSPAEGYIAISPASATLREIIYYTAKGTDGNGTYLTVTLANRGLGGTTAQTHAIGESVRMNVSAETIQEISDALDQIVVGGTQDASTTAKGISKLSVAPASASNPIAVGDNDQRLNTFISLTAGEDLTTGDAVYIVPDIEDITYVSISSQASATATSLTYAHTVSGTYPALSIFVKILSASDLVTSVTYAGVACTRIGLKVNGSETIYLYGIANATAGSNNVVVSCGSSIGIASQAALYNNVYSVSALNNTATGSGSATTTLTTIVDKSLTISCAASTSASLSAGTGATLRGSGTSVNLFDGGTVTTPAGERSMQMVAAASTVFAVMGVITPVSFSEGIAKAGASIPQTANTFIGFATETVLSGAACKIVVSGVATLSGLVSGLTYYLSDTAGSIDITAGTVSKKVGISLSSTKLLIRHDN